MKFILSLVFLLCVGCVAQSTNEELDLLGFKLSRSKPLTKEDHLLLIVRKASDKVASAFKLSLFGFGILGPDGIQGITLDYTSYERMKLEEIRKLMVDLGQDLLHEVNLGIEQFNLEYGKLNLSFFYLAVSFKENEMANKNSKDLITSSALYRDKIDFDIHISIAPRNVKTYTESFDEAYQKVYGHPNSKENSEKNLPQ